MPEETFLLKCHLTHVSAIKITRAFKGFLGRFTDIAEQRSKIMLTHAADI